MKGRAVSTNHLRIACWSVFLFSLQFFGQRGFECRNGGGLVRQPFSSVASHHFTEFGVGSFPFCVDHAATDRAIIDLVKQGGGGPRGALIKLALSGFDPGAV